MEYTVLISWTFPRHFFANQTFLNTAKILAILEPLEVSPKPRFLNSDCIKSPVFSLNSVFKLKAAAILLGNNPDLSILTRYNIICKTFVVVVFAVAKLKL